MAQYGRDQEYGRDNVHQKDEYGNPVRRTDEYETVVQSATGERYERDVRHVDEFGNTIHITEEFGINPGRTGGTAGHQGLGTNMGQVTGGTGTDYTSGGRTMGDYGSTHQTGTDTYGHQGLGAKVGQAIGGADYSSGGIMHGHQQGLGQATKGVGAGTYTSDRSTGHQGLGTQRDTTLGGIMHADPGHHQGLGQATKGVGAGTYTGDRSTGNQGLGTGIMHAEHQGQGKATKGVGIGTGHQGIGTDVGSAVSSTKLHTATPLGGAGIGTGSKDVYPTHGSTGMEDTQEKKGVMQKIKEKLPGGHTADEQQTTGHGYGDTHEKKGMMEKIKEKLPGHH